MAVIIDVQSSLLQYFGCKEKRHFSIYLKKIIYISIYLRFLQAGPGKQGNKTTYK